MHNNRRVIVVGGAGGIGSTVCRMFAAQGDRVVVADFNVARARAVAAELEGGAHDVAAVDVTNAASVDEAFDRIEAEGPASVLVIASGGPQVHLGQRADVATLGRDVWDRTLALNLTGVFNCLQTFARLRLARPLAHGRILLVGSTAGAVAGSGVDIAYVAAKAALAGLARQAAFELAPAGVTVNVVAPGPVGTPEFFRNTNEAIRQEIAALTLFGRLATPEEVGAGIAYLASPQADFVTGSTLPINGGVHMA
ncbi:MAG: 3-oxoacyl-[acyl-carrier-protein] reductase FabG [Paracidovorax wautersii]|uniref:3-oxoacyl-[acyl-carrier-protein] reductase FabG n=1 Tax=Paracidovorax wautersii TaxID=1177982 RepID=A0A7V8JS14_9BURK|nr:MAG: 3-oxoacyl-[acyl-carrier-protein] reductase FabG [Paracidovorax wautersii]